MASADLIKMIRAFEATHGIKPTNIKTFSDDSVQVTFDTTVLYQTKHVESPPFREEAWRWLNDRDTSFDEAKHKDVLIQNLKKVNRATNIGVVDVKKRFVKLPIPYLDLALPWKRAGTKVRDYTDLATQPVKITLSFSEPHDGEQAIKDIIAAASSSLSLNQEMPLPSAAKRASWNPIKWILHGIAYVIPHSVAQVANKLLPNKFIKASRPYEWGTNFSEYVLDTPFSNSGLVATTVSPLVGLASCAAKTASTEPNLCMESKHDKNNDNPTYKAANIYGAYTPEYTLGKEGGRSLYNSRLSVFAQSTTRIVKTNHKNIPAAIETAITRARSR